VYIYIYREKENMIVRGGLSEETGGEAGGKENDK
jgi:hypothetical protein